MHNPTKQIIESKFCANCGALIQLEKKNDTPEYCPECGPWMHVHDSVVEKTNALIKRHDEAIDQLRKIADMRKVSIARAMQIN